MKHVLFNILIIAAFTTVMFLPYIPGDYDHLAIGLSSVIQLALFPLLLMVPVGLVWALLDFATKKRPDSKTGYPVYLKKAALIIFVITIVAMALGAFISHNRFLAIIILVIGVVAFRSILRYTQAIKSKHVPYYFIFIPLCVFIVRSTLIEKVKTAATNEVIANASTIIGDIEAYKNKNGFYPLSLHSTIEDYKPSISGVRRFYYEPSGESYNLYFEQFSDKPGTEEIVMYNPLDRHEMTVHNEDLLRIPSGNIIRGYREVMDLPQPHWKAFYFD